MQKDNVHIGLAEIVSGFQSFDRIVNQPEVHHLNPRLGEFLFDART